MTRTYALLKLLDHADLTMADIIKITGCPARKARKTVGYLASYGRIERQDGKWKK